MRDVSPIPWAAGLPELGAGWSLVPDSSIDAILILSRPATLVVEWKSLLISSAEA